MTDDVWIEIGPLNAIPPRGARIVKTTGADVAVFRTGEDGLFALDDRCPHRGGPLSQGIVHGSAVTCPLHNWVIGLLDGEAQGADEGCVATHPVRLDADGIVRLGLSADRVAAQAKAA